MEYDFQSYCGKDAKDDEIFEVFDLDQCKAEWNPTRKQRKQGNNHFTITVQRTSGDGKKGKCKFVLRACTVEPYLPSNTPPGVQQARARAPDESVELGLSGQRRNWTAAFERSATFAVELRTFAEELATCIRVDGSSALPAVDLPLRRTMLSALLGPVRSRLPADALTDLWHVGRKSACFETGSLYVQQCEDSLSGDAPLTEAETQLLRELQDSAAGEEAHLQALAHARHWLRGFAARLLAEADADEADGTDPGALWRSLPAPCQWLLRQPQARMLVLKAVLSRGGVDTVLQVLSRPAESNPWIVLRGAKDAGAAPSCSFVDPFGWLETPLRPDWR